jgi:PAS domain S-box-containing protein
MEQVDQIRPDPVLAGIPRRRWRVSPVALALASTILLVAVRLANLGKPVVSSLLFVAFAAAVCAFIFLSVRLLSQLRRDQRATASALKTTENEFESMASHIQEVFWMIEVESRTPIYINEAFESLTGYSCDVFMRDLSFGATIIHSGDRAGVLAKFEQAAEDGEFDERFRIVTKAGAVRWVWARGFPLHDEAGRIRRMVGTLLEITEQKEAEEQVAVNLEMARSAWAEAEAMRKTSLALTENLRMNSVMDALLRALAELIPYSCARVLVKEGGPHVLALGEQIRPSPRALPSGPPLTVNAHTSPFLERVLAEQASILIADTRGEKDWHSFKGHSQLRSWLGVPLVASGQYLGLLSVGHQEPNRFTSEHLRRAELLAIPAAVAIQSARLYARAEIYGLELEKRLTDLDAAESALALAKEDKKTSEDKFQKVFRSSPIAFSITTLGEGRFLEVNRAFELRYGFSREELIGRTVHELRMWEEPADRALLVTQLGRGGPLRYVMTRLRVKSGEIKLTAYSADKIQFDGHTCILAVSEDVLSSETSLGN